MRLPQHPRRILNKLEALRQPPAPGGYTAKSIHVWIQAPAYVLAALSDSEAFVIVTGLELPPICGVFLFWLTIDVAAAVSISLSPVSQDPHLAWVYGPLAVVSAVAGTAFYTCSFRARKAYGREEELVVEGEVPSRA
ncbi:uncharacterized protein PG986_008474 [Apiospora aurea]|uniref:Uncharacterized protein n=1 Tax=Apiospora aurea TaxID=335848 RepID=A0ABR1QFI3_9PEZI